MNIPDNLKAFNYITLRLFEKLYEAFPEPIDIDGLRFVIECVIDEERDVGNTKNLHLLNHTVSWLEEEGFLTTKGKRKDTDVVKARLTLKGLTIIGYLPASIDGKEEKITIIDKAKEILGKGMKDASTEAVKNVVSSAFSLMARYAVG